MRKIIFGVLLLTFLSPSIFTSCGDDKQVTPPSIQMDSEAAFPKNCATVFKGQTFEFNAVFTDEEELGSFNLEIHNNFDHHSHGTDGEDCHFHEEKGPGDPFVYNKDFTIPSGQTSYNARVAIDVPADIATGAYHFMVRVTNRSAWQEIKGISIRIADR